MKSSSCMMWFWGFRFKESENGFAVVVGRALFLRGGLLRTEAFSALPANTIRGERQGKYGGGSEVGTVCVRHATLR